MENNFAFLLLDKTIPKGNADTYRCLSPIVIITFYPQRLSTIFYGHNDFYHDFLLRSQLMVYIGFHIHFDPCTYQ